MANAALELNRCSRTRAFTLTELAIVLGIIGVIISAIWSAAGSVYENNRTKRASEQVVQIVNGLRAMYGSHQVDTGPWATDITSLAINNDIVPADMYKTGGTTAFGPWSGSTVNIYSGSTWNVIGIQYSGLSQAACNQFADALIPAGNSQLVYAAIAATGSWFSINGNTPYWTTTQINGYCVAGNGNYVQLLYSMN